MALDFEAKEVYLDGAACLIHRIFIYDDVEPERTPVRSPVEKWRYDNLEENPPSTPIEGSGFIEKDS